MTFCRDHFTCMSLELATVSVWHDVKDLRKNQHTGSTRETGWLIYSLSEGANVKKLKKWQVWPEDYFPRLFVPFLWRRYLRNVVMECLQIWYKCSLAFKEELIRIRKVRGQGHCDIHIWFWPSRNKVWGPLVYTVWTHLRLFGFGQL